MEPQPEWWTYFTVPAGVVIAAFIAALVATMSKRQEVRDKRADTKAEVATRLFTILDTINYSAWTMETYNAKREANPEKFDKDEAERALKAAEERRDIHARPYVALFEAHLWLERPTAAAHSFARSEPDLYGGFFQRLAVSEIRATRRGWLFLWLWRRKHQPQADKIEAARKRVKELEAEIARREKEEADAPSEDDPGT